MTGRGRTPCCDKTKVKKGPWSPAEDFALISFIQRNGHSNWRALPKQAGLMRCGKSCRLRWINYLKPDVKRGSFSPEEEETIIRLQRSLGNKWSTIASHLPGRTDNEIKNIWNTSLKKRLGKSNAACDQNQPMDSVTSYSASPSPSWSSCISYGDLNVDQGPGIQEAQESVAGQGTHDQNQNDKFSAVIMQAQWKSVDEPKEELSPGYSDIASNVQSLMMSTMEVSRPMEETTSPLHSNGPSVQVQNLMTTEAKQGNVSDQKIEIPLDSDVDFWSKLGSLNSIQPWEFQPQEPEIPIPERTCSEGDWFKYLENELGLASGTDSDSPQKATAYEELMMNTPDDELIFMPEISTWPSLPEDFGF